MDFRLLRRSFFMPWDFELLFSKTGSGRLLHQQKKEYRLLPVLSLNRSNGTYHVVPDYLYQSSFVLWLCKALL